jgi:hypothetical protein
MNLLQEIKKHHDTLLAIVVFIFTAVLVYNAESVYGGADTYHHFMISSSSWNHPDLLLDHWGKPIFTVLGSPFAQFGLYGLQLFNCLILITTAWCCSRILKHWKVPGHAAVILVLPIIPSYFLASFSGLTEPLFGLFLIGSILLFIEEKYVLAALLISFIPLVRNEGMIFLPIFGLALFFLKQWKVIFLLGTGLLFYSVLGYFFSEQGFFWLIKSNPYDNQTIYGAGEWDYYLHKLPEYVGSVFLWISILGLVLFAIESIREKSRARLVFLALFLTCGFGYFILHSYAWWKGEYGALGLERILIPFFPFLAISILLLIGSLTKKWKWFKWLTVPVILIGLWQNQPWSRIPFNRDFEEEGMYQAANEIMKLNTSGNVVYAFDPRLWYFAGLDLFSYEETRFASKMTMDVEEGSFFVWDSHFGANEGETSFTKMLFHPDLKLLGEYMPDSNAIVLGGYHYKVSLFKSNGKNSNRWTTLNYATDFDEKGGNITLPDSMSVRILENESVYVMDVNHPFIELTNMIIEDSINYVYVSGFMKGKIMDGLDAEKALLVVAVERNGKLDEYYVQPLDTKEGEWQETSKDQFIQNHKNEETRLKVYVWYFGQNELLIQNLKGWTSLFYW